jgi:hypothetical protein
MLPRLPTLLLIAAPLLDSTSVWAATLSVPDPYPTVQAAVEAAADGDVIEIAAGTYRENVRITGKNLTLRSLGDVAGTVIEGVPELVLDDKDTPEDPTDDALVAVPVSVIEVRAGNSDPLAQPQANRVVLMGLTVTGGDSGVNVRPNAHVEVLDSHIVGNSDGIELEGRAGIRHAFARATVRRCEIWDNDDDGVDVDQRAELWIEDSIIRDNDQDGIEIRLQDNEFAAGERIENLILRNRLEGNGQDGLQLIDYDQDTPREFRVERNLVAGNGFAGLGMMGEQRTIEREEALDAWPIAERVELVHNTFSHNRYGVTGGANLMGVSNLFVGHAKVAVKNVVSPSQLAGSMFHGNGTDHEGSSGLDLASSRFAADPLLEPDLTPGAGSPAIDAGPAQYFVGPERILDLGACDYRGDAPDLGARERDTGAPLREVTGMLLAPASEAMIQKGGKRKAATKHLDLGSKNDEAIAGLRFERIGIPPGAQIATARLHLVSAKKGIKPAALLIQGEASADAAPLGGGGELAARAKTAAFARWEVPLWPAAGLSDQTPELAPVLQEIVDGPAWDEGNAATLLFTGVGRRSVAVLGSVPLLHADFHYRVPICPSDL